MEASPNYKNQTFDVTATVKKDFLQLLNENGALIRAIILKVPNSEFEIYLNQMNLN